MYGEVLKFGAMIVDSLRTYKHPVFVYIPPGGELRGGAWVVIDPTINLDKMEMYADKQSRGGILEPPGICEVKYREPEQKLAMHRLDTHLQELDNSMGMESASETSETQSDIKQREKSLSSLYTQIAHEFADLHDRSGRMKAKGCITDELEWADSRTFFYWRIQRRQAEDAIKDKLIEASRGRLAYADAGERLTAIIQGESDKSVVSFIENNQGAVQKLIKDVQVEFTQQNVADLFKGLSADEINKVITELKP